MSENKKNFDTGLRILEVLKILLDHDVTKQELIELLKVNSNVENVYTKEAFLKYFNTLEITGLKIVKAKDKYKLKNGLFEITLSKNEEKALYILLDNYKKLHNNITENAIVNIIHKLAKYIEIDVEDKLKEITEKDKIDDSLNVRNNLVTTLKNMLSEKQLISLTYEKNNKIQETIIVELKEILEKNNNIFIICYNRALSKNKKINIKSIVSIKQLARKVPENENKEAVVFCLYGRLIHLYKIRPNEVLLDFNNDYITISSLEEDKEALMQRILKYGENCKIIKPKSFIEDFLQLTDKIIANLE